MYPNQGKLAPGVEITDVQTLMQPPHGGWNTINITLQVDPREIDVFTNIVKGLRDLMSRPSGGYSMTSSVSSVSSLIPIPDDHIPEEGDWTVEELEENGGVPPEEVKLEDIKAYMEERFDAMEQAVRLAIGE